MTDPSWRQLAAIPETLHKRAILHALSIEAPPEGISDRCDLGGGLVLRAGEGGLIAEHKFGSRSFRTCVAQALDPPPFPPREQGISTSYSAAREVLKLHSLHKGTPSGDLARWWLTAKGYID